MKYARIEDNRILDVITPPEGLDITDCLHPDALKIYEAVSDDVEVNWVLVDGVWSAPPPPVPTKPVTADQFRVKLLFLEKVKWDNPDDQGAAQKTTIKTVKNDFAVTGTLDFLLQSTVEEIDALEVVGVLGTGRAAEIISELTA